MSSTKEELNKMKVEDLKKLCKDKNIAQTGKKVEIVDRLLEAEKTPKPTETKADVAKVAEPAASESTVKADAGEEGKKVTAPAAETPAAETTAVDAGKAGAEKVEGKPEEKKEGSEVEANPAADEKDLKAKMIERAKRFNMAVPEVEQEKKIDRAKRFGISVPEVEQEKKAERAKRFGMGSADDKNDEGSTGTNGEPDVEKLKARAARFGTVSSEAAGDANSTEEDKLNLRAKRFASAGGAANGAADGATDGAAGGEDDDKKAQRAKRFGMPEDDGSKKKQRLERFGMTSASEDDKKEARAKRFTAAA